MDLGSDKNVDAEVARGFGAEWSTYRQDEISLAHEQRETIFQNYFQIFPWQLLPSSGGIGADIGCGTGRWSMMVAPRVAHLHLIDVSAEALAVARENLHGQHNVSFDVSSVAEIPLPDHSLDFAFSLGVLHHVPDTQAAINAIAAKLKKGAPFLVYLYYAFDNRSAWYRALWAVSNSIRLVVSRFPHVLRRIVSEIIAATIYWPFARFARLLSNFGISGRSIPLSWYAEKSFYVMRTDAYDRFCTRLEKRFTRAEIEEMLQRAGFEHIRFSDSPPYWCAVGIRSPHGIPN